MTKIGLLFGLVLSAGCGVSFVTQTLDGQAEEEMNFQDMMDSHEIALKDFSSKMIFKDAITDEVWGFEKNDCYRFQAEGEDVFEGKKAIHLEWNSKDKDCDWMGMGFGWDGWKGKSIGDIMFSSAIQLRIKNYSSDVSPMPIIVFLLEDYSNTQVAVGLQSSFLERGNVDGEWQKLTVPLYLFNFDKQEADAFNVKQLILEVQGQGDILIDDIEIIPYQNTVTSLAAVYNSTASSYTTTTPSPFKKFKAHEIYNGNLASVWGVEKSNCKDVAGSTENAITAQALELEWSNEQKECSWIGMGFGWNNYEPKDLTSILENGAIEMSVKAPQGETLYSVPFVALMEDYNSKQCASLFKSSNYSNPPITDEWQKVYLPLKDLDYEKIGVDMSNIKQLNFQFLGSGHIFIDDIRLVNYTAPQKIEKSNFNIADQLPVTIFNEEFINGNAWGMVKNQCRDFSVQHDEAGNHFIQLNWQVGDIQCSIIEFGASWNKWEPVNFSELKGNETITFKYISDNSPHFKVGFETYEYQRALLLVAEKYTTTSGEWTLVQIPLATVLAENEDFNLTKVKQLIFNFEYSGSMKMDAISIQ